MKKIRTLLALTALLFTTGLTSCAPETGNSGNSSIVDDSGKDSTGGSQTEKTVTSLEIMTQPTKKTYYVGEKFDPTGMVVTARYSDNSRSPVTDYEIDKTGPLTLEDTTITISYQGKTATVSITVRDRYLATIEEEPTKDVYRMEAEDMNFDNCKAGPSGSNSFVERPGGAAGESTSGGACAASLGTAGNVFLADFNNLSGKRMVDIRIVWGYGSNDNMEIDKWLTLGWNDQVLKTDYVLEGAGAGNYYGWKTQTIHGLELAEGENSLSFTVNEVKDENGNVTAQCPNIDYIEIDLSPAKATKLNIVSMPSKTTYYEGDTFDATGLVIEKVYEDGGTETLAADEYTITPDKALTTADTKVTVTYQGLTVDIPISVLSKEEVLQSIRVKTNPAKLDYKYGEVFDPTGLAVEAVYKAGEKEIVRDIALTEVEIVDKDRKLGENDKQMVLRYGGKECTIAINVTAPIDAVVWKTGTYVIEAESKLNDGISTFLPSSPSEPVKTEGSEYASNGTSVHSLAAGTEVVSYIELREETEIQFIYSLCRYEPLNVKDCVVLSVDGEDLVSPDLTLGTAPGNDWHNFKDADFGRKTLSAGVHKITLKLTEGGDADNRVPNLDCLKLIASPDLKMTGIEVTKAPTKTAYTEYETLDTTGIEITGLFEGGEKHVLNPALAKYDQSLLYYGTETVTVTYEDFTTTFPIQVKHIQTNEEKSYRIEAESFNLANAQVRPDFVQAHREPYDNCETASGKRSLCGLNGGYIPVSFETSKACKVEIRFRLAAGHPTQDANLDDSLSMKFDEKEIGKTEIVLPHGKEGGSDLEMYFNWDDYSIATFDIQPGVHTLVINILGQICNIDCIDFVISDIAE